MFRRLDLISPTSIRHSYKDSRQNDYTDPYRIAFVRRNDFVVTVWLFRNGRRRNRRKIPW